MTALAGIQKIAIKFAAFALLAGASTTGLAQAQTKPIRIVVPYAAGGPIDTTARWLADKVKDSLGTVIIENKPGAGGNIGADAVAKAAPDGYTLGIAATATHVVNPWLYSRMPYDALKDFTPITEWVRVPNVLVMNAATADRLGIRTLADFVRYAKANPGKLNYGSGGNGSAGHLAAELFKAKAGIFAVHIPYNGGNPAQLALLAGQVDFNIDNLATAAPNIKAGKLKALAVTSAKRADALPDVPAMAESMPGFDISTWWGVVGPAGLAPEVVRRLNDAFTAALRLPETQTRFAALLTQPAPSTPAQFAQLIASQHKVYGEVVKRSGAKVD